MKKKFFAMYALAGALVASPVFTSCVDSEESPSVTAQRELNASKIKALTELYNAQAQATKAQADAEVALKAAQAAYQQAMAEAQLANAAEQARKTQEAQEKFALELETIKAEYAARLAEANANKANYENQLWNNTEAHIATVYNYYNNAVSNVNTLNENLLRQLTQKSLTESNAVSAEQALTQQIADLNAEKVQKERELAKWEEIKKLQPSKDEYQAKLDELEKVAYDLNQNKIPAAKATEATAEEAYKTAKETALESEGWIAFKEAMDALNEPEILLQWQNAVDNHWNEYHRLVSEGNDRYNSDWNDWYNAYNYYWNTVYPDAQTQYNNDWNDWMNNGADPETEPKWENYEPNYNAYVWQEPNFNDYMPDYNWYENNVPRREWYSGSFGGYETYTVIEDSVEKFVEAFGYTPNGFTVSVPTINDIESAIKYGTINLEEKYANTLADVESYIEHFTGKAWEKNEDGEFVLSNGWELADDDVNFIKSWNNTNQTSGQYYFTVKDVESMLAYRKQLVAAQKEAITAKKDEITAAKTAEKTEAEIALLEANLKTLNDKLAKLEDTRYLDAHLTWAKEQVAKYEEQKAEIEENQKDLAANLAIIKDNTAITEALASLEETAVAYLKAKTEKQVLENALQEIGGSVYVSSNGIYMYGGEYADIQNLMNGIVDVQNLIDNCKERLQQIENTLALGNLNTLVNIEERLAYIYNSALGYSTSIKVSQFVLNGSGNYTYEDALAIIEAQIANLEKQIEIQEVLVKKYEAELQALLNTDTETEA